jgi:protein-S-isoprenylcysteine O-methyltransferase
MPNDVHRWINGLWILLGLIWLIGSVFAKRAARAQTTKSRLIQLALTTCAFLLLFEPHLEVMPLTWRFLPASAGAAFTGLALAVAGGAVALWARILLGRNWSAKVTIKRDHEIIRGGPYAMVRHPIYSGFLLALLGTALAIGEARGLLAFGLAFAGWWLKLRTEETFLVEQFGAQYTQYRREVKALIPFVL